MDKTLSYFMPRKDDGDNIIEIRGLEGFKDEKGNVLPFKVKVLSQKEIQDIYEKYRKRSLLYDKRGNPIAKGNEAIYKTETDAGRAMRHIISAALVYPDLKDKDLMEAYGCVDISEMPLKVFSRKGEYQQIERDVLTALGILDSEEGEDEVAEAKN